MADYYVYSSAAGAGTGADWANAMTTLAAALAAAAAGDTAYVADDHAESTAGAVTLTSPGTAASPCRILCVLRSGGSVPPVSADLRTTATVATSSGSGNSVAFRGFAYCRGVTFSAGVGSSNLVNLNLLDTTAAGWWLFDACTLELATSQTGARINVSTGTAVKADHAVRWHNTKVKFSAAGQGIISFCDLSWDGTNAAVQGTVPTVLFLASTRPASTVIVGVDLSVLASGASLFTVSGAVSNGRFDLQNCKLGSSVAVTTGSVAGQGSYTVRLINCDSADTNYRYYRQTYQGTVTQETTIVRTGGATDGTTTVSRKMVSTADSKFYSPLESDPVVFWNETTGSNVTVSIPVLTDNVTLTDADCWLEVEYLGTSGFPLALFADDRAADILATGTNQATDATSTWTTTGLGTPVQQTLDVTFTPQEKGLVRCRVMLARASTTVYFDPKALSTSGRQYTAGAEHVNEGAGGSGGGGLLPLINNVVAG